MARSLDVTRLLGVPDSLALPALAVLAVSALVGLGLLLGFAVPSAGTAVRRAARHVAGHGCTAPAIWRGDLPG